MSKFKKGDVVIVTKAELTDFYKVGMIFIIDENGSAAPNVGGYIFFI